MKDKDFLNWVADRFVNVLGESEHVDFVQKLRAIADTLPPEQDTSWLTIGEDRMDPAFLQWLIDHSDDKGICRDSSCPAWSPPLLVKHYHEER